MCNVSNGGNEVDLTIQVPASKSDTQKEWEVRRRRRN